MNCRILSKTIKYLPIIISTICTGRAWFMMTYSDRSKPYVAIKIWREEEGGNSQKIPNHIQGHHISINTKPSSGTKGSMRRNLRILTQATEITLNCLKTKQ